MPSATITATTTQTLTLKPTIKRKLMVALKSYMGLKGQREVIDEAMKKARATAGEILMETGESSISVEGFKTTLVAPVRKVFNKQKFIALGGNLDFYNAAMDDVPGTPYTKITTPSDRGSNDDE